MERMTIYDVFRHLINSTHWGADDIVNAARQTAAIQLVDKLEEAGLLGQVALDITINSEGR